MKHLFTILGFFLLVIAFVNGAKFYMAPLLSHKNFVEMSAACCEKTNLAATMKTKCNCNK